MARYIADEGSKQMHKCVLILELGAAGSGSGPDSAKAPASAPTATHTRHIDVPMTLCGTCDASGKVLELSTVTCVWDTFRDGLRDAGAPPSVWHGRKNMWDRAELENGDVTTDMSRLQDSAIETLVVHDVDIGRGRRLARFALPAVSVRIWFEPNTCGITPHQ